MGKGHKGLPKANKFKLSKSSLLATLKAIDGDPDSTARVLRLETAFRARIDSHVASLPQDASKFKKFSTSPFVLMIYTQRKGYSRISQIEGDILPAKIFSSMETSAGRMIETVVLPEFGWECVLSEMHTATSNLDGKRQVGGNLMAATLKSGPRCLNDGMSEEIANAIHSHSAAWAKSAEVTSIDFTYGVLYGTKCQSNKKDWHILRRLAEKLKEEHGVTIEEDPSGKWHCKFRRNGVTVKITIRIGEEWWNYLGGEKCLFEVCIAFIRACVTPGATDPADHPYVISDLGAIVEGTPANFNSAILQVSQVPWLFFLARHFCDTLEG